MRDARITIRYWRTHQCKSRANGLSGGVDSIRTRIVSAETFPPGQNASLVQEPCIASPPVLWAALGPGPELVRGCLVFGSFGLSQST
ncbi:hypothetical protein VFPPC_16173 [Pochonia chlamydosporia 170]|uniref:Uncharacterized protein n=1 Tax=Pochonia chlamydosporia 170 TaxID=1380566 RepID=A0A179FGQ7_METCM|nr:hypothetical protein VFPPC_16173 [Pochonia chlamydosporia 170]OAQ64183.1 hypothetical protein VFPPC_16173 [Pochonia chlamydosporia 170]